MHKHKKYTYTVKLCGVIGFPVVDEIENPLLKNLGVKKPLGRAPLNHSPARQWRVCSRIWRVKIA